MILLQPRPFGSGSPRAAPPSRRRANGLVSILRSAWQPLANPATEPTDEHLADSVNIQCSVDGGEFAEGKVGGTRPPMGRPSLP